MQEFLSQLNIEAEHSGTFAGQWLHEKRPVWLTSSSPVDGSEIAKVALTSDESYEALMETTSECFRRWRMIPAPKRGEIIRQIAGEFRALKKPLAELIAYEMGKLLVEAEGEVQEVIDIADFAVGLSRQLYGRTMHSERPKHRMYEQWHPLGNMAVITAFNFPAAVWSWNAMIAAVCGNSIVWKPSEITPLTSIAVTKICHHVTEQHGFPALFSLLTGTSSELGQKVAADSRFPLVSATGSCRMGRSVAQTVGKRLGKTLLELGGNNAVTVLRDADLDLAVRAVLFGAVGTAGQRCTTTRRVIVERDIQENFTNRLLNAYKKIRIGNPLETGVLMGPLINEQAVDLFSAAIERAASEGGTVLYGGKVLSGFPSALYVEPTIILAHKGMELIRQETFAPILYIIPAENAKEAVEIQNAVPQGLSSALFTQNLQAAEDFLSHLGSDCGIANINIGTSGAEIGGAFGGEKETGGGREAGSDAWKAYMRRQTNTINWGEALPLAQGIEFGKTET